MKKYTSAYFYVIIDGKEKFIFYEFDKSELTELFRARDASCPKGKKMDIRNS